MNWLKAVAQAAAVGGVIAAAAIAPTMAADGFNRGEWRLLGSVFFAGALSGVAMLFKTPPRDPSKREREGDRGE